jgi:DNA-binding FadR family transcriptional regulator
MNSRSRSVIERSPSTARQSGGLKLLPRRQLIHQAVQAEIKGFIVQQRLKPGDSLPTEGELAQQLGVSRNSVREAVKALEGLGVLEARVGTGLFVRDFSLDALLEHLAYGMLFDVQSLSEILGVRLALETGMAKAVVTGLTEPQLADLDGILVEWNTVVSRGEYPPTLDRQFHEALYANVDNALLAKILDAFWRVFYEAREHALVSEVDDPMGTYGAHVAIVDALHAASLVQLTAALEAHHQGIQRRISTAVQTTVGSTIT